MDRVERCVYFPVCRQNPDAIIRCVWLLHRSCPSARPTPPLLDSYTHVHKLFTSVSGPSPPTPVCFSEFIREPAFRCDKLLIMHLGNTDKACLYWKKTEASLIGQTHEGLFFQMSSPVGREDVRSLWVDRWCCNMYVCCVRERWGALLHQSGLFMSLSNVDPTSSTVHKASTNTR